MGWLERISVYDVFYNRGFSEKFFLFLFPKSNDCQMDRVFILVGLSFSWGREYDVFVYLWFKPRYDFHIVALHPMGVLKFNVCQTILYLLKRL